MKENLSLCNAGNAKPREEGIIINTQGLLKVVDHDPNTTMREFFQTLGAEKARGNSKLVIDIVPDASTKGGVTAVLKEESTVSDRLRGYVPDGILRRLTMFKNEEITRGPGKYSLRRARKAASL